MKKHQYDVKKISKFQLLGNINTDKLIKWLIDISWKCFKNISKIINTHEKLYLH